MFKIFVKKQTQKVENYRKIYKEKEVTSKARKTRRKIPTFFLQKFMEEVC